MLINGHWQSKWDPVQQKDEEGRFIRQSSVFTERLTAGTIYEAKRLTLYVAYICPWASRTLIARSLLGLEEFIDTKIVDPVMIDYGWKFGDFPGSTASGIEGVEYMHHLYTKTDQGYTGRATVPVLWDTQEERIINNESSEILKIFNTDLRSSHHSSIDLCPSCLKTEINAFNEKIYHKLNNGVYRAGFASSQQAYEEAVVDVFATLDWLESHFQCHQFAVSEQLTESDIRLFVTLIRFDVAYHGLFKTNIKPITSYSAISDYLERLLQIDAFSKNTRIDHIKSGYYSVQALNPLGIVPVGPFLPWFKYLQEVG